MKDSIKQIVLNVREDYKIIPRGSCTINVMGSLERVIGSEIIVWGVYKIDEDGEYINIDEIASLKLKYSTPYSNGWNDCISKILTGTTVYQKE